MNIQHEVNRLLRFALARGLVAPADRTYAANRLIAALSLGEFLPEDQGGADPGDEDPETPGPILERILDYAARAGLVENTPTRRDLFDTLLMDCLMPRPSEVVRRYRELRDQSPEAATDYFYRLSIASNYIRKTRTDRNVFWRTPTEYGELDITINVSKPEKDPRDIAAARAEASGYPRCPLCRENEGFSGNAGHPARQTLRLIPLELGGETWFFQYSPYIYYREHCIILKQEHVPMRISRSTFENLFAVLEHLPRYFVGANADLPLVGGSILSHDHYQGGRHSFPMDRAPVEKKYALRDFPDVDCGRVCWPMSVLRLGGTEPERLVNAAERILDLWRDYSDEGAAIQARSGGQLHNTITPIARRREDRFELDLVLRNNRTSAEHPEGIFHPHRDVQHIKKENIGLIEVMGLSILAPRLITELEGLRLAFVRDAEGVEGDEDLAKHALWYRDLKTRLRGVPEEDWETALRHEVGRKCLRILHDAGVFKRTPGGMEAFDRFAGLLT